MAIEKPYDKQTLDILERLVSGREQIAPYRKKLPVSTESNKSARDVLAKMGAVQTNRTILEILEAAEETKKSRPGLITAFLDPKKGSLFAPARFGSAGLADIFGLGGRSEGGRKLRKYNPLESALRSARGEFAVTGGDIIPVRESDNLVKRGGKLIGAFAWDVLTDPTSYIGGASALSRKGVIETAATQQSMRNVLDKASVLARQKFDSQYINDVIQKLASNNDRFVLGDIAARQALDKDNLPVGPVTFVRAADGAALSENELLDIASYEMSSNIAEAFQQRGASGVRQYIQEIFGSERYGQASVDFADEIFQTALPRELVGGLYLINPITGKRLVRIAGGTGRQNAVKDFVNQGRFTIARGTRGLSKEFGGEAGPIYAEALGDMHPSQRALKGSAVTTLGDYLEWKQYMRQRDTLVDEFSKFSINTLKTIVRGRRDFEKQYGEEAIKAYDKNVTEAAWRAGSMTDEQKAEIIARNTDGMTSEERAIHMADRHGLFINNAFKELGEELLRKGIDIPLQANFLPLFFSKDALKYLRKYEPRQGLDLRDFYSGEISRETFEAPMTKKEIADFLQVQEGDVDKLFASPIQANLRARELYGVDGMFESDIVNLLSRYTNWASNRMATQVTVDNLRKFGVLIKVDPTVTRTINANNAQAFIEAAEGLSQAVRTRLMAAVKEDEARIRAMASEDAVTAENVRRKAAISAAQNDLLKLEIREAEILGELSEVRKVIKKNTLTSEQYVRGILRKLLAGTTADRNRVAVLTNKLRSVQKVLDRQEVRVTQTERRLRGVKSRQTRLQNIVAGPKTKTVVDPLTGAKKRTKIKRPSDEELQDVNDKLEALTDELEVVSRERDYTLLDLNDLQDVRTSLQTFIETTTDINVSGVIALQFEPLLEAMRDLDRLSKELVVVRNAKKDARVNLKTANLDSRKLRAKEINTRIEAYLAASDDLVKYQATLRGIKKDDLTPKQVKRLAMLKNKRKIAMKKLEKAIDWTANRKTTRATAGRQFARELRKHVKNLSTDNARLLTVFTDPQLLEQFTLRVVDSSLSHDDRMDAFTNLFNAYRSIRKFVTEEDMQKLTELQRRLYNPKPGTKEVVIEEVTGPYTAQYSKLQADLAAAEKRNDGATVGKLRAEIRKVEMLSDDKMLSLVGANKNVRVPRAYQNIYASLGIRRVIERIYQVQNDPNEWEKIIRGVYDPLLFVWKTQATVGRGPAYVINNLVSAIVNNYIGDVTVSDHWVAARLLRALDDSTDRAQKFMETQTEFNYNVYADKVAEELDQELARLSSRYNMDMKEIFMDFMESPAWWSTESAFTLDELYQSGLTGNPEKLLDGDNILGVDFKFRVEDPETLSVGMRRFRRVVNFMVTNPVQRKFSGWAQKSEVYARLAAYVRGRKKFGNHNSALNFTYALHFDYRDLGQAEQWTKRLAPFYTWNRYNIPLQLRTLFFQSDKMKNLVRLNENFEEYFGADSESSWMEDVMPEWFDLQGGWISRFGFAGRPLALSSKLPIYDIERNLQVHTVHGVPVMVLPRLGQIAQQLGPGVAPLEWITNVNFDTGRAYKDDREKLFRTLTGLVPLTYTIKRGVNAGTLPFDMLGAEVDLPLIDEKKNASDAINLFIGSPFSAQTISEQTLMSGLMDTNEAQVARITELAAKANVDVEWLRKMIRRGLTVRQIKTLVDNGYGAADLLSRQRALRQEMREPSRDYGQLLQGFIKNDPNLTGYSPQ